jgi:hypothetical protein
MYVFLGCYCRLSDCSAVEVLGGSMKVPSSTLSSVRITLSSSRRKEKSSAQYLSYQLLAFIEYRGLRYGRVWSSRVSVVGEPQEMVPF